MPEETNTVELEIPECPNLDTLPDNVAEYILFLLGEKERLEAELNAKPGIESRGIAFLELYGQATDRNDNPHLIKINVTQRSDISMEYAVKGLLAGLTWAKSINLTPYVIKPPKNGKSGSPSNPSEPAYTQQEELP